MVTRYDKSSKTRVSADYMLLYRMSKKLGKNTVEKALNGNIQALAKVERYAWEGKKKPAVVAWVNARIEARMQSVEESKPVRKRKGK